MAKRKRKHTMSPKARRQRRTAAIKTGENSKHPVVQAGVAPCTPQTCPKGADAYPCDAREQNDAWSFCVPSLFENADVQARYRAALQGNPEGLEDLATSAMAAQYAIFENGVQALGRDGVVVDVELVDGPTVQRLHPAAEYVRRIKSAYSA